MTLYQRHNLRINLRINLKNNFLTIEKLINAIVILTSTRINLTRINTLIFLFLKNKKIN